MQLWQEMEREGMEELIFCHDADSGLRAVIAIHSTALGPALGGCRYWTYASEEEAVRDAVKLAKGMTYKNAISGLPYGGGKVVIWDVPFAKNAKPDEDGCGSQSGEQVAGDLGIEQQKGVAADEGTHPQDKILDTDVSKRAQRFHALGRCLERLNGRYVTGLDLGTTATDMDQIRLETAHVTDTTGSLGAQDDFTAEMTAYGVHIGIVTSLRQQGIASLQGIPVAVQGLGKVGYALCRYLHAAGARLIVADVVPERVQRALVQFSGAISADPAHIHAADCKVFAPCALGGGQQPAE
ncbi:Glu/Leu/Phe/Val dehydrogenase dimerization domain-containing protein [Paenibacillus amylolyticus]|uniref:Glu/Leu/Phe/Val dehydrogenase dimerization domain-containing protein n=1 Tax=Paenibacillus amylolyticus TaxID=1451 RepID=UPI0033942D12